MPTPAFRALLPAAAALACALAACATAGPAPDAQLDRAFARIQVHEAEIERARIAVERGRESCPELCATARSARTEGQELCGLAREIADHDALARCERAERATSSIAAQAARRCACK